ATLTRGSAPARSSTGRTCAAVLAPSARHSSQFEYVWPRTLSIIASRNAAGGLYTGTTTLTFGDRANRCSRWRARPAAVGSYFRIQRRYSSGGVHSLRWRSSGGGPSLALRRDPRHAGAVP